MIHLYTGDGKGKTTASLGMAVRAAGHDKNVLFCQFMKDGRSGELLSLPKMNVRVWCSPPMEKMTFQMTREEYTDACKEMHAAVTDALELIGSLCPDMVIFDELATAIGCGMIGEDEARKLIRQCGDAEVVVTGRYAPEWLMDIADYLSVIDCRRHPYQSGAEARIGIEW